jgi:hypothetical protein
MAETITLTIALCVTLCMVLGIAGWAIVRIHEQSLDHRRKEMELRNKIDGDVNQRYLDGQPASSEELRTRFAEAEARKAEWGAKKVELEQKKLELEQKKLEQYAHRRY